jgi:hypothetical protein
MKLTNNIFSKKVSTHPEAGTFNKLPSAIAIAFIAASLSACGGSSYDTGYEPVAPAPTPTPPAAKQFQLVQGLDNNSKSNALLSLNPGGPGGSPNQSLRAGNVLVGSEIDDIIVGGLGVDVLIGYEGDDILIGGTEDFNSSVDGDGNGSDNRDRALGYDGDDTFIWAPGDGSDFFDGGDGIDVIIFGVLGESSDAAGNSDGAPFFGVNPPSGEGSQDFDGIFLDENNQPTVRVSESPGFCTVLANADNQTAFNELAIDNIVRFTLRGIADAFDAGDRADDDGLRVAVTVKNTEFLVCTKRELDSSNSANNIEVIDISGDSPVSATLSDLPQHIQNLIQ